MQVKISRLLFLNYFLVKSLAKPKSSLVIRAEAVTKGEYFFEGVRLHLNKLTGN